MKTSQQGVVEGLVEEGEALRRLTATAPSSKVRPSRVFHSAMAGAFLVTAFVAFAPTYYLRGTSDAPPLHPLLHVHGAVFTSWLLLVFVQSALVASHRVELHKKLGIAGVVLAASMVPLGIVTAVDAAARGITRGGLDPLSFMIFPVGQVLLFAVFFVAAVLNRKDSERHRRFIVVATACLMPPALARLPIIAQRPLLALAVSALFLVAGMLHDWRVRGRPHRVYVIGCLALVLSGPIRFGVAHTPVWQAAARALVG